jgi:putative ABC transport system permease protein
LREPSRPLIYQPLLQSYRQVMTLHVRTTGNPSALVAAVRREVQTLDKDLPIFEVKTLSERLRDLLLPQRSLATLIGFFGLLTLSLVSIGLYGVMSYLVTERTHEMGIRIALGARRTDVLLLVLRQGIILVVIGTAIGLVVTLAITRILSSALYGVGASDALTYIGASLLIIFTALLACSIPARRATKVDPLVALKYE